MDPRSIFGLVFSTESVIAAVVFVAICAAVALALVLSRRRKRAGRPPSQRAENNPLEIAYGVTVAAIAAFVIFLSLHTTNEEAAAKAVGRAQVRVTGFQWCWRFSYPGHHIAVTGACRSSHLPTMVVPAGVPVTIQTTSSDVIHSWWVPGLRYKMDAFPNHTNRFTMTVGHPGRWIGRCAEFCGNYHYTMDFYLKAVPLKQYRQWLASHAGGSAGA